VLLADAPGLVMMDKRMSACLVTVIALHGALLVWAGHLPSGEEQQTQARTGRPVEVRLMTAGQATTAIPAVPPAAMEAQATAAASESPHEPLSPLSAPAGGAPTAAQDGVSAQDLEGYVPRRWLTVAPQPTVPLLLPFPEAFKDRARYKVALKLYIEADGRVGRVEFEGVPLPEILQTTARSTFEHARFTPGQVNGRIVKSLIRVEVDFDGLGAG